MQIDKIAVFEKANPVIAMLAKEHGFKPYIQNTFKNMKGELGYVQYTQFNKLNQTDKDEVSYYIEFTPVDSRDLPLGYDFLFHLKAHFNEHALSPSVSLSQKYSFDMDVDAVKEEFSRMMEFLEKVYEDIGYPGTVNVDSNGKPVYPSPLDGV